MNEVVVVGSGRSVLGRGLGERIDSFNNIVRFHPSEDFIDKLKYKKDTGSRMTIFSYNANRSTFNKLGKKITGGNLTKKYREISQVLCTYGVRKKILAHVKKVRSGRAIFDYLKKVGVDYTFLGHRNTVSRIKDSIEPPYLPPRVDHAYRSFTGGFQVLCYCLHKYDRVYICGFDALAKNIKGNRHGHFYGRGGVSRRSHSLAAESKIVRELMKQTGKIEILG